MSQEHPLITDFLNYLRFERHSSPHTGKCYAADLHQFTLFLVGGPDAAATASVPTRGSSTGGYTAHPAMGPGPAATATASQQATSKPASAMRTMPCTPIKAKRPASLAQSAAGSTLSRTVTWA